MGRTGALQLLGCFGDAFSLDAMSWLQQGRNKFLTIDMNATDLETAIHKLQRTYKKDGFGS